MVQRVAFQSFAPKPHEGGHRRCPSEAVKYFHHWTLRCGDVWFELEGMGKSHNGPNNILEDTTWSNSKLGATYGDIEDFNARWNTKPWEAPGLRSPPSHMTSFEMLSDV